MPERIPLPSKIAVRAFRTSEARSLGIGEGRLRNQDLERPYRGVRLGPAPQSIREISIVERCRKFQPLLRTDQFFSHWTAAELWRIPLPFFALELTRLHVSAIRPALAPRMAGIVGHHTSAGRVGVRDRFDLPTSDPVATWLALAETLDVDDLIAAADHLVLKPVYTNPSDARPFATISELNSAVEAFQGRGARNAKRAIGQVREGSESRPETLLRLLFARAHLPEPLLNVDVYGHEGRWLGRADLVWPEWRTIAEYDGDHHRTSVEQYEKDISRIDHFTEANWRVVRVRKHGLFADPLDTVARLTRALRAGGWKR